MTRWPTGFPPSSHPSHLPPSSWITRARHDSRQQFVQKLCLSTNQIRTKEKQILVQYRVKYPQRICLDEEIFCLAMCVSEQLSMWRSAASATYSVLKIESFLKSKYNPKVGRSPVGSFVFTNRFSPLEGVQQIRKSSLTSVVKDKPVAMWTWQR